MVAVCVVSRVASILTIPGAVILDYLLQDYVMSWKALVGMGTILVGFIGLTVSELMEVKMKITEQEKDGETERLLPDNESQDSVKVEFNLERGEKNRFRQSLRKIRRTLLNHIL